MIFGRPSTITRGLREVLPLPSMIDDEYLDTQAEPSPVRPDGNHTVVAFFVKSLELFDIVNDIQYELYAERPRASNRDAVGLLVSVLRLDSRLVQWAKSLPCHLQYHNPKNQNQSLVPRRQRVVLRAR